MQENEMSAKERVLRGVEEVGRGVRDVSGGVLDAAESAAENIKDTIKSKTSGERLTRDNVVMVRVDKDSLARMDELVETELASSRSNAAALLITDGIKARQGLFNAIHAKVNEIRKAKEKLRKLRDQEAGWPD